MDAMIDITQDNTSSGAAALARSDRDGDLGDGPRVELQADQGPEASLPERVASPLDAAVADARTRFDAIVASTRQALGRLKANAENGARGIPTRGSVSSCSRRSSARRICPSGCTTSSGGAIPRPGPSGGPNRRVRD